MASPYNSRIWWAKEKVRTLRRALYLLIAVVIVGTLGYYTITDLSLLDSIYMTVITLTTVGYREVTPLTDTGKVFTIVLIIVGVGTFLYGFTLLVGVVVEGELKRYNGYFKMEKRIASFTNHTIVCGYGRLARIVVADLLHAGHDLVVIDNRAEAIAELENTGAPYIEGNAYEDETLKAAGISRAKNLLALLSQDADNVYVTLCARDLNPNLHIIARTEINLGESRLRRAGANVVFAPYQESATRVVQKLVRPFVSDFLDIAVGKRGDQLVLEQVVVPQGCALGGRTLEQSGLRTKTGVIIAAVIDTQGQMNFNPNRESIIESGSTMIVLGQPKELEKLSTLLVEK